MTNPEGLDGLLILDKGLDRAQWLKARKPVFTATQASAIAGSHPYARAIDVWNEKTDPDYDPDKIRNMYLDERAELGVNREPEIIKWASADPRTGGTGNPFQPNSALVALPENPNHASTPDAFKRARDNNLVLLECKTTQQSWDEVGIPQHVIDQCLWQMHTTGAVTVWVAAEIYSWNRGKATFLRTFLKAVHPDPRRLAFLLQAVAEFAEDLENGIPPESDIDITQPLEIEFGDSPEVAAEKLADNEKWAKANELTKELFDLETKVAADTKRIADIKKALGDLPREYHGRRVWMVTETMILKLGRSIPKKPKYDTDQLPEETLREIATWPETTRLVIEPNPEYTAKLAAAAKAAGEVATPAADNEGDTK